MNLQRGQLLDQYRLVEKIGEGGMGVVWKAFDTRLKRHVALKILPPELLADPERVWRFKREAQAAAALNHPNIATVHGVGEMEKSSYIVMELVEGRTLRSLIGGKPLPIKNALRFAAGIAEGLAHAHQARLMHRDLKPDNIMIRPDQHPKILDFGLARLVDRPDEIKSSQLSQTPTISGEMTREGRVLGTARYMSPEQARGDKLDTRSDIFSFGATFHEMLTGRAPFQKRTIAETLSSILRDRHPAPSEQNPSVMPELDHIVAKCLEKNPEDRYQSTDDLVVDIRRAGGSTERALHGTRPRTRATNALVLAIAAILGVLSLAVWLNVAGLRDRLLGGADQPPLDSLAVLPLANLSGDAEQEYLADGMTEALITELSRISALRVISRTSVMKYKNARKSLPEIARDLNVDAVIEGSVFHDKGRVRITAQLIAAVPEQHLWADTFDRELSDILALSSEVAQAIARRVQVEVTQQEQARLIDSRRVDPDAYRAHLKGEYYSYKYTMEGFLKSLEFYEEAISIDPEYALAYSGVARAYSMLGALGGQQPAEFLPKAKEAALRAVELDDKIPQAHATLGMTMLLWDWDWAGAERELKRGIELGPSSADTRYAYGIYLARMARMEDAIVEMRRARDLDPLSLRNNTLLGWFLALAGRNNEAINVLRHVLDLDPTYPMAHWALGVAYENEEMFEEAIAELEQAEKVPLFRLWLARAYALVGHREKAMDILNALEGLSETTHLPPTVLALVYSSLGNNEEAIVWLEKGYEARDSELVWLRSFPQFEDLRSDPRVQDLLRRMELPE